MASIVLSLTLDNSLLLLDKSGRKGPSIHIRVGTYAVPGQLRSVLEKVLVGTHLDNLKETLEKMQTKIEFLSSDEAHIQFLRYEVGRLVRGFQRIRQEMGIDTK